jgi:hypothetical protein
MSRVCREALERWQPALRKFRSNLRQAGKELLDELAVRASARICVECSGPIRWWETGHSLAESSWMHQTCWDGRQFFRQFIAHGIADEGRDVVEKNGGTNLTADSVAATNGGQRSH